MALPPRPSPQQPSSGRAVTAGTLWSSTFLSGAAVVMAKHSVGLGGNGCHPRSRARSARPSAPRALWRRVSGGVGAAAIPVAVLAVGWLLAPPPSSRGAERSGVQLLPPRLSGSGMESATGGPAPPRCPGGSSRVAPAVPAATWQQGHRDDPRHLRRSQAAGYGVGVGRGGGSADFTCWLCV